MSVLVYPDDGLSRLDEEIAGLISDPASEDLAAAVRRSARQAGDLARYAAAFVVRGQALAGSGLNRQAVDSFLEAALVFEEELDEPERAAEAYAKVLEVEPGHRRALFSLSLLHHDLARFSDLIDVYRRRLRESSDDGERATLRLYMAELYSERLGDHGAAFKEIMAAVRLAPQNLRIISRLEDLGERIGCYSEVAIAIGDLILGQDDPRVRAALSLRLAELYLGPLADPERALACLRAAIADDGGDPASIANIEDVFRERSRFDELSSILSDSARDRRVRPHRVRLERDLARLYEYELNDPQRALSLLVKAIRYSPQDRELLDEIMRLGLRSDAMALVAETYEWVVSESPNTLLRTYMRLKLGNIYSHRLNRPADAIRVHQEILREDPMHQEARRRLTNLYDHVGGAPDPAPEPSSDSLPGSVASLVPRD